jgi:ATP-dependent DNA helicase
MLPPSVSTGFQSYLSFFFPFLLFSFETAKCLYHGTKAEREELRINRMGMTKSKNGVSHRKVSGAVNDMPVIITSYDILMRDIGNFRKFSWAYLVVDEGHRLKNKDCKLMRELKSLDTHQR